MSLSLQDWFRFADRTKHSPDRYGMIQTHGFGREYRSDRASSDWEQEEWSIKSFLVPLDGKRHGAEAGALVAASPRTHNPEFRPWWRSARRFDFAEVDRVEGVSVRPWIYIRNHRITEELLIEPRADFLRYHALDAARSKAVEGATDYIHPLEESVVLRTVSRSVGFYDPSPFVEVQKNYLKDYLSARKASLLISVVADRFAYAPSRSDLKLQPAVNEVIGDSAWLTTTVHDKAPNNRKLAMGRTSLYWNLLIEGYQSPKRSRNPWHVQGNRQLAEEAQPLPTFVANDDGERAIAENCPAYLAFNPRVLERFFTSPGSSVGFHMRTWGTANSPHGSVDVGINSLGLLHAFMPDIARLPVREQNHWASFSVFSEGEVCVAMLQTRMQLNPPILPSISELVLASLDQLRTTFKNRFQIELNLRPAKNLDRINVGPVGSQMDELGQLAMFLNAVVTESLDIGQLRAALLLVGVKAEKGLRQLALLRSLLEHSAGIEKADAKRIVGPLDALNELRSNAAHVANLKFEKILPHLGLGEVPVGSRAMWDSLVDAVSHSLRSIAGLLNTPPEG